MTDALTASSCPHCNWQILTSKLSLLTGALQSKYIPMQLKTFFMYEATKSLQIKKGLELREGILDFCEISLPMSQIWTDLGKDGAFPWLTTLAVG